jgi:glycine/D-amino acid oxidase-like deaminating enzyme
MPKRIMNLLSPSPYWPIKDGIPADYPALEGDVLCDVVILGAGISGALAAHYLGQEGITTVVLDRRDVGHGSTAGSTSLLQYEIDMPLHRLSLIHGEDRARRAYLRCREAIGSVGHLVSRGRFDCGFRSCKSLFLASERAHVPGLRLEFKARNTAGIKVAWWDQARIARESSLGHHAGILSDDGAQVDAYALTHCLLRGSAKKAGRIFDRTEVTSIHRSSRGVVLRTRGGARVRAAHLVVASGYEGDLMLPRRSTEFRSTYALITEPVAAFVGWPAAGCLIWETSDPYVYLRTTEDGRIIIGGYDEDFRDPKQRDRLLKTKTAMLSRRLRQLFPSIAHEVAYSWAGTFARTPDGLPYIGRHREVPRTWFALGYGGNGIVFSVIAAQLIRDKILGIPNRDEELFGFDRAPSGTRRPR